jgi:PAS domain S-box-containing protein
MLVDYRVRQREYLLAISRALTAELDLADVLRIIVQASVEFISARAGVIILADPTDRVFRIAAVYGLPRPQFDDLAPFLQGFPYDDHDIESEVMPALNERMKRIAQAVDLPQLLRLPLMSGEMVIGFIYLFQTEDVHFNRDLANLLQSFADQAAIAVKNARLYQQVIAEKQRLDAILNQSADGVMILDAQLEIAVINAAFSRMVGWKAAEAIGRPHQEVIQWAQRRTDIDLEEALANGWPPPGAAHLYVEGIAQRPDGDTISLGITYAPLLNDHGRMTNIIANVRDLTRFREEEQLHKTFISVISHELKTPVSIIKGYAGTLRRRDANWPPEVQDEYLSVIEEESDRLTDLIDNLLEASRLQSGAFKLEMSADIDLIKLATDSVRRFSSQTDRHRFEVNFPPDFPLVYGDERRLTQVFNNLISNAIKYSPDGRRIRIWGENEPGRIAISVSDEGIGIPEYEQRRIFQQFSRLDNALSRKTEGSGLGLFLTKAIVEAHGGRIWFAANSPDPGTTFTFSLPR